MAVLRRGTGPELLAETDRRDVRNPNRHARVVDRNDDVGQLLHLDRLTRHPHEPLRTVELDEAGAAVVVIEAQRSRTSS